MSDLEIFQIAGAIALALKGEKEAIADVELLLKRHPEMFENAKDVVNTINKVVSEPEIIMDNPQYTKEKEILSAKKLDDKKMGEVIIKNDNGTNVIFHANKKNIKNKGIKKDLNINIQQKIESEAGEEIEVGRKTVIAFLLFLLIFLIPLFTETLSERKYDNQITYDVVNENNYEIILNNNRYFLDLDFDDEQYASAIKNSNIDFTFFFFDF